MENPCEAPFEKPSCAGNVLRAHYSAENGWAGLQMAYKLRPAAGRRSATELGAARRRSSTEPAWRPQVSTLLNRENSLERRGGVGMRETFGRVSAGSKTHAELKAYNLRLQSG